MTTQPKYPDTAHGAIEYLKNDSVLDLTNATAQPDPSVAGVWKVTTPNDTNVKFAIVLLAGYRSAYGTIRERDDFETIARS